MEEAFKREKEEADRLLRAQKLEYESKIVELQKQVMETSMSQSMLSSILSSTGLVDTSTLRQTPYQPDLIENDDDTLSCKSSGSARPASHSALRLFVVRTGLPVGVVGVEEMALPSNDLHSSRFSFRAGHRFVRRAFHLSSLNRITRIVFSLSG